jgi:nitrogenase subunit NifH
MRKLFILSHLVYTHCFPISSGCDAKRLDSEGLHARPPQIESHSLNNGLFLAGNIPFDPAFTKAMVEGRTLFEYNADSQAAQAVKTIWEKVTQKIGV